jgi:hypothetical protein
MPPLIADGIASFFQKIRTGVSSVARVYKSGRREGKIIKISDETSSSLVQ